MEETNAPRNAPRNADESRHYQRCRDTECAESGHAAYHQQDQAQPVVVEPGDPDWDVVNGYGHIDSRLRQRRLPTGF